MKNLIVFTTKYGSVEKTANLLAQNLTGDNSIVNLKIDPVPDLMNFDKIILGGSIYMGKPQAALVSFAEKHKQILLQKKLGIFVNCAESSEKKYDQIKKYFPREIYDNAKAIGFFGDEIIYEKCNFMDKLVIRLIKGNNKSYSHIDNEEIAEFARKMNDE